jgi:hypothetical protein
MIPMSKQARVMIKPATASLRELLHACLGNRTCPSCSTIGLSTLLECEQIQLSPTFWRGIPEPSYGLRCPQKTCVYLFYFNSADFNQQERFQRAGLRYRLPFLYDCL